MTATTPTTPGPSLDCPYIAKCDAGQCRLADGHGPEHRCAALASAEPPTREGASALQEWSLAASKREPIAEIGAGREGLQPRPTPEPSALNLDGSARRETGEARGFYVASKTIHAGRWCSMRAGGQPIISTWIDEAGLGETSDFADLWRRCVSEAAGASFVLVYREPGEVLKGAFVEVGAALASGTPVRAVGCDEFSFVNHPLVTVYPTLDAALSVPALTRAPDATAEVEGLRAERDRYSECLLAVSGHLGLRHGETGPCDDPARYDAELCGLVRLYEQAEAYRVEHSEARFKAEAHVERLTRELASLRAQQPPAGIGEALGLIAAIGLWQDEYPDGPDIICSSGGNDCHALIKVTPAQVRTARRLLASTGSRQDEHASHRIIEAAETMGFAPEKLDIESIGLTIQWPDGSETSEIVSPQAASVLGYVMENDDAG